MVPLRSPAEGQRLILGFKKLQPAIMERVHLVSVFVISSQFFPDAVLVEPNLMDYRGSKQLRPRTYSFWRTMSSNVRFTALSVSLREEISALALDCLPQAQASRSLFLLIDLDAGKAA